MKQYIGIDIIEIERIAKNIENTNFIKTIYTENEQKLAQKRKNKAEFYAGRYAAKEAIYKAINGLIEFNISWQDVEIIYEGRTPKIIFLNEKLKKFEDKINISISHNRTMAISFVTILI